MLSKRVAKLEANQPTAAGEVVTLDSVLSKLEAYPGELPRNETEAAALGYSCAAEACADSLGMSLAELKEWLRHES